jgi:hypothetical protein
MDASESPEWAALAKSSWQGVIRDPLAQSASDEKRISDRFQQPNAHQGLRYYLSDRLPG